MQLIIKRLTKPPPHIPYHPWDWCIHLHLVDFYGKLVGKYTVRPMDPTGMSNFPWTEQIFCKISRSKELNHSCRPKSLAITLIMGRLAYKLYCIYIYTYLESK